MSQMEQNALRKLEKTLALLELEKLPKEWVKEVWDKEFMDNVYFLDYEAFLNRYNRTRALESIVERLKNFVSGDMSSKSSVDSMSSGESWRNLTNIVNHKALTAVLFTLINHGEKHTSSSGESGLYAARLYIIMLTVPGSGAFRIYHSQMFINLLKVFKFGNILLETEKNFNDSILCTRINSINRLILNTLEDLLLLIESFNFRSDAVCIEEILCSLVDLIDNALMSTRTYIDKRLLDKIAGISQICIDKLIVNQSSNPDSQALNIICKSLTQKFITFEKMKKRTMIACQIVLINYCKDLIVKYDEPAVEECLCLIEHLCCDLTGLERAVNRVNRVKLIVELMYLLPKQVYIDQLQWIVKLSKTSIPTWRSIALDIIGLIIIGDDKMLMIENDDDAQPLEDEDDDDNAVESSRSTVSQNHGDVGHKELLQVIVERCEDISCAVRNSALTILVNCTVPKNEKIHFMIKDLFGNGDVLLKIVSTRFQDERVAVRKTAVKLIDNLLQTREELVSKNNLNLIVERCRDTSIQVRTSAITTLTNLTITWKNMVVAESWLDGVLNQLSDPEVKIHDIVLNALRDLLFVNIIKYNTGTGTGRERFPWILLSGITRKNMRRHLSRACRLMSKDVQIFNSSLIEILTTHIKTENNLSCWVLLSCVARHIPIEDVSFVLNYFYEKYSDSIFEDIPLLVLVQEVLCEWCMFLNEEQIEGLKEKLIRNLRCNLVPSGATRGTVSLIMRLSKDNCDSWANPILESYESMILNHDSLDNMYIDGSNIIAMADVALAADNKPSDNIINLLISLAKSFADDNRNSTIATKSASIAALGKFSLRDRGIAQKTTKLCSKLLVSTDCPLPLKINAMCVLTDMSIRYTSIVEPVMPNMYICLANENLTIKRMAVQLITHLLVSEFIKLRNTLYFNYFTLICDVDEKVKDTATYYLFQCLATKDKNIIFNNFLKSILFYNNFENPITHLNFEATEEEKTLFSMQGNDKKAQRHYLYDMMLSHMSQVQRLRIQERICSQAIIIGESGIDGSDVLRDCLTILKKLPKFTERENNDDLTSRLTNNIVSQKMKHNVNEKIIPMVLRLHRHLKISQSPLMLNVIIEYACDLLKDYKQEVEDVFERDEDLLDEIKKYQTNTDVVDDYFDTPQTTKTPIRSTKKPKPPTITPKRRGVKPVKRNILNNVDDADRCN